LTFAAYRFETFGHLLATEYMSAQSEQSLLPAGPKTRGTAVLKDQRLTANGTAFSEWADAESRQTHQDSPAGHPKTGNPAAVVPSHHNLLTLNGFQLSATVQQH
jgi:hypothetical protein